MGHLLVIQASMIDTKLNNIPIYFINGNSFYDNTLMSKSLTKKALVHMNHPIESVNNVRKLNFLQTFFNRFECNLVVSRWPAVNFEVK